MGQKVHPYGFRLGFNKPWRSRWFSKGGYAGLLQEDLELQTSLREQLKSASVSSDRSRPAGQASCASRHPARLAPRHHYRAQGHGNRKAQDGAGEEDQKARSFYRYSGSAQARTRCPAGFRESIALPAGKSAWLSGAPCAKPSIRRLRFGCKGIKVRVPGRLNGAEIARSEWYLQGAALRCTCAARRYRLRLHRSQYDLRRDRRQDLVV